MQRLVQFCEDYRIFHYQINMNGFCWFCLEIFWSLQMNVQFYLFLFHWPIEALKWLIDTIFVIVIKQYYALYDISHWNYHVRSATMDICNMVAKILAKSFIFFDKCKQNMAHEMPKNHDSSTKQNKKSYKSRSPFWHIPLDVLEFNIL